MASLRRSLLPKWLPLQRRRSKKEIISRGNISRIKMRRGKKREYREEKIKVLRWVIQQETERTNSKK